MTGASGFPSTDPPSPFTLLVEPAPAGPDSRALLRALWARRGLLAACALGGAALAFGLSLLMPPVYVATVAVLEAPRQGGGGSLNQLALSAEMLGLSGGNSSGNTLTYPDILRSRRLLDGLLMQTFPCRDGRPRRLIDTFKAGPDSPQRRERALGTLRRRLDIALDRRTNLLRLGVADRDPVLAAAVANAACAALQDLVTHAMTTQAGANRRFVEGRLALAESELSAAEGALRVFRERNAHPEGSPRLSIDQAVLLRAMRTREEIVIALTRQYEMARVDENRDVPVLNVLDPAVPPAFRSSPRRGLLALGGLLFGLAGAIARAWPRPERRGTALREAA